MSISDDVCYSTSTSTNPEITITDVDQGMDATTAYVDQIEYGAGDQDAADDQVFWNDNAEAEQITQPEGACVSDEGAVTATDGQVGEMDVDQTTQEDINVYDAGDQYEAPVDNEIAGIFDLVSRLSAVTSKISYQDEVDPNYTSDTTNASVNVGDYDQIYGDATEGVDTQSTYIRGEDLDYLDNSGGQVVTDSSYYSDQSYAYQQENTGDDYSTYYNTSATRDSYNAEEGDPYFLEYGQQTYDQYSVNTASASIAAPTQVNDAINSSAELGGGDGGGGAGDYYPPYSYSQDGDIAAVLNLDKIKVTLPRDDYAGNRDSYCDEQNSEDWLNFEEKHLYRHVQVVGESGGGGLTGQEIGVRQPKSSKKKRPAPPPPKPPPPSISSTKKDQQEKIVEENQADANSGDKVNHDDKSKAPPPRPALPKINIVLKGTGKKQHGKKMSDSFDEEASFFKDSKSSSPKKSRFRERGIFSSPKKKEEKSAKTNLKNEKEKVQGFMTLEEGIDEKSEEWMKYEEMEQRIKDTLAKTQEKMQNLETSLDELGLEKSESSMLPSSPWVAVSSSSTTTAKPKPNPKEGWVGFEDNFNVTPNLDPSNKLAHLTVTPLQSPNHSPKPPQNSRSVSLDDLSEKSKEGQLLDLSFTDQANNGQGSETVVTHDLLGLDDTGSSKVAEVAKQVSSFTSDLLGLLDDTPVSVPTTKDTTATVTVSQDISLLSDPLSTEPLEQPQQETMTTSTAAEISSSIVDEFLGITPTPAKTTENQTDDKNDVTAFDLDILSSSGVGDGVSKDAPTKTLQEMDSDLFGLGCDIQVEKTSKPLSAGEDLFDLGITAPEKVSIDPLADMLGGIEKSDKTSDETTNDTGNKVEDSGFLFSDPFTMPPEPQPQTSAEQPPKPSEPVLDDAFNLTFSMQKPVESTAAETTSPTSQPQETAAISRPRPKRAEGALKCDGLLSLHQPKSPKPSPKHDRKKDFLVSISPKVEPEPAISEDLFDTDSFDPRTMDTDVTAKPVACAGDVWDGQEPADTTEEEFKFDPFESKQEPEATEPPTDNTLIPTVNGFTSKNPFLESNDIPFADVETDVKDAFFNPDTSTSVSGSGFNPFATITDSHEHLDMAGKTTDFDPFQTIHEDEPHLDNLLGEEKQATTTTMALSGENSPVDAACTTPPRFNPFDKEPPLDENYEMLPKKQEETPPAAVETSPPQSQLSETVSTEEDEIFEEMPPLEDFYEPFTGTGWKLMLRLPIKKKLTQNRHWKPVFVKLVLQNNVPTIKVYNREEDQDPLQELPLQPAYNLCNMGLQTYDQFGKCHTIKLQYIFYRESIGVKPERLTPTLGDLVRVRDLKALRDLVHKPKTTMILDHAPQTSELLKFGSLNYADIESFIREVEDALFRMESHREKTLTYTKDEIRGEVLDEYIGRVDKMGHVEYYKARVRLFFLAFITGMPTCELGMNDKYRRGKEVVGRHDIIPIKTEEWIKIEAPAFHNTVDPQEYEKTRTIKFNPLDACKFELMRFRVRVRQNRELPLQVRAFMLIKDRHVEMRMETMIPGYFSNSRRAGQVPCDDIQIRFPIPEPWIYLFRVEKRFGYGSVKATTRKPGKIKGLERITMMAQGILPPSLIEVSTGSAKYEHLFRAVVWRINKLPERNEGAYKVHLFALKLDLGPHDILPETFEHYVDVSYTMPSTTVSKTQVRSISVNTSDPPDKWVKLTAKYNYQVEIEFKDKEEEVEEKISYEPVSPTQKMMNAEETEANNARLPGLAESDSDFSSDDD